MSERPMGIQEAAEAVGVHPNTLRKLERAGLLPPAKRLRSRADGLPGHRYFFPSDIEIIKRIIFPAELVG